MYCFNKKKDHHQHLLWIEVHTNNKPKNLWFSVHNKKFSLRSLSRLNKTYYLILALFLPIVLLIMVSFIRLLAHVLSMLVGIALYQLIAFLQIITLNLKRFWIIHRWFLLLSNNRKFSNRDNRTTYNKNNSSNKLSTVRIKFSIVSLSKP